MKERGERHPETMQPTELSTTEVVLFANRAVKSAAHKVVWEAARAGNARMAVRARNFLKDTK